MAPPHAHATPAYLDDLDDAGQKKWSDWVEMVYGILIFPQVYKNKSKDGKWVDKKCIELDPTNELNVGKDEKWDARLQSNRFYNQSWPFFRPEIVDKSTNAEWPGFPNIMDWAVYVGEKIPGGSTADDKPQLVVDSVNNFWKDPRSGVGNNVYWQADDFRVYQDEYLEWAVVRNEEGKITKITFTCEGPEVNWFDAKALKYPGGTKLKLAECFKQIRPNPKVNNKNWVRAEFSIPEGHGFVVGDLVETRDGETYPINYGSQIAQYVTVGVTAVGGVLPDAEPPVGVNYCSPRNNELKEMRDGGYRIPESSKDEFLHVMQYKVLDRGIVQEWEPWKTWIETYPDIQLHRKADGGTGKKWEPPLIKPEKEN
ncbi:hypothetical protein ABW20_dc0102306 [Dactylellina cionopaga]|nr:hypothetical protein ABW20_dc0102306 [Dactylellina cionopaga]